MKSYLKKNVSRLKLKKKMKDLVEKSVASSTESSNNRVINLMQDEDKTDIVDVEDIIPPTVEKIKKVRAPKKKKEEPPIAVSEDEEPEESVAVEDKKKDEILK